MSLRKYSIRVVHELLEFRFVRPENRIWASDKYLNQTPTAFETEFLFFLRLDFESQRLSNTSRLRLSGQPAYQSFNQPTVHSFTHSFVCINNTTVPLTSTADTCQVLIFSWESIFGAATERKATYKPEDLISSSCRCIFDIIIRFYLRNEGIS